MQDLSRYNARVVEEKWRTRWEREQTFRTHINTQKPKYYVLEMFPYPSGNIHMGHVRNYTLGDVMARFKRAQGFNVLHPMGWDAFGLPAENAAIERGAHPADWTHANIKTMREQLKLIGFSYDWAREIATCEPEYYKHEQLFFLRMVQEGIAYRKEAYVNWDPVDNTVLANEQVVDGRGWRSGAAVERRKLSQWFLRISDFAEDLLQGLSGLNEWPEKVRIMQERWIGKSTGATLKLRVEGRAASGEDDILEIYTTRPDTIFGMSFCAIAPNHPLAIELSTQHSALSTFIQECNQLGTSEEAIEKAEKKGFDTGLRVKHPFEAREVPLYVANFVLMDYGTGAIFGCPAHDARDFEFATKYELPILPVIGGEGQGASGEEVALPYTGDGVLINSPPDAPRSSSPALISLNGLTVAEAKIKAVEALEKIGAGSAKINYRLRDWGISRQRYWGCPIPMIHCKACGIVPVPEAQLPVELPRDVTFDAPGNPLARHPTWKHVPCPACGAAAERETDTFDTFFESSWYFFRFATMPEANPLAPEAVNYWAPVDCYIGGIEHAVLHLLYSRFFTRALAKCGLMIEDSMSEEPSASIASQQMRCDANFKMPTADSGLAPHANVRKHSRGQSNYEPFKRLETQGMVCHMSYQDANGKWISPEEAEALKAKGEPVAALRIEKMSKSKKNTVDPRAIMEAYGADAARLFMMSDSPPERDLEWTDAGIEGAWRYLQRVWKLTTGSTAAPDASAHSETERLMHQTILGVAQDIERFHFNKAVARIREFTNALEALPVDCPARAAGLRVALQLLNPFLPHLTEECWEQLGHTSPLSETPWPVADTRLAAESDVTIAVQVSGKLKATLTIAKDSPAKALEEAALALPAIQEAVKGKTIAKIITVANRIVNVVAN